MSLSYVALGDSLTIGVGSALFAPGFVHRYRELTSQKLNQPIRLTVFARSRYDTEELIHLLKDERLTTELKAAHIITLTVGGNDFLRAKEMYKKNSNETAFMDVLKKSIQNMSVIIGSIHALRVDTGRPHIIRIPNLPYSNLTNKVAQKWIDRFNQHLTMFTHDCNLRIIDINNQFRESPEEYLTYDGKHLNDVGHKELAHLLVNSGYGRIGYSFTS